MPIHDWTRVKPGIFHDFHHEWISSIRRTLNAGLLPPDYYALAEQTTGKAKPDLLTLHAVDPTASDSDSSSPPTPGGLALTSAPPKIRIQEQAIPPFTKRAKSVVVRHVSDDRVVAMIEIVSPGNKGSRDEFAAFIDKSVSLIRSKIHLLVLDVFPSGKRDRKGIHRAIWSKISETEFEQPPDQPLTFASYSAGSTPRAFVEPAAVGDPAPEMPLFLTPEIYINVPLEATYMAPWAEVPRRWRQVIDPAA